MFATRGVVLMYVREHISFCKRNYLILDNLEMVYIQIIANLIANRFYAWYRPPNSEINLFDYYELFLCKVKVKN